MCGRPGNKWLGGPKPYLCQFPMKQIDCMCLDRKLNCCSFEYTIMSDDSELNQTLLIMSNVLDRGRSAWPICINVQGWIEQYDTWSLFTLLLRNLGTSVICSEIAFDLSLFSWYINSAMVLCRLFSWNFFAFLWTPISLIDWTIIKYADLLVSQCMSYSSSIMEPPIIHSSSFQDITCGYTHNCLFV